MLSSVSSVGSGVIGWIFSCGGGDMLGLATLGALGAMAAGGGVPRNCLPSRISPPTPATAAPTAVTPAARRNLRRSTVPVIVSSSGCRRARA